MTHQCSNEHDRELERHSIHGEVEVYDCLRDLYIGRLVNIHAQGLMIIGELPLEEDKLYTLDLHLPEPINGHTIIQLGIDCLWARDADLADKFWMGCAIIDISPQSKEAIMELIERFGEAF